MPFSFPKAQGPTLLLAVFTLSRLAQSHNLSTSLLPYIHLSKGAILSRHTQNGILSRTCISGQKSRDAYKGQGIFTIWGCSQLTWETSENAWMWGGHGANSSLVVFIQVVLYEFIEKWLCLPSPARQHLHQDAMKRLSECRSFLPLHISLLWKVSFSGPVKFS